VFEAQAARRAGLRRHGGKADQDTGGGKACGGEENAEHRRFSGVQPLIYQKASHVEKN
jgi:hypothetical protein